ncbi:uncharacterized protein YjdB [Dysgonomonadaceae bacterium PH5-43]|nr:uncharacterized protein YjdB [Dysgonomonadaceae bacterium PH5-43]
MKKTIYTLALLLFPLLAIANLTFDVNGEYLITCYDTQSGGVVIDANTSTPLSYNSSADKTTDEAFWIIKEETSGMYSFKNVATNQYIRSTVANRNDKYVSLSNTMEGNNNLFTIEERYKNGELYYAVKSVSDPTYYFNKRSNGTFGTYSSTGSGSNEAFYFTEREDVGRQPIEEGVGALYTYLESITFNEKKLIEAKDNNYYFSIPYNEEETTATLTVEFTTKLDTYSLKINDEDVVSGQIYTFENATLQDHKIEVIEDDNVIASEKIVITSLPIVQLYTGGNSWSSNFSSGKICVNEGAKTSSQTGELLNAQVRHRGATALGRPKKSFAIKLRDANNLSVDRSFFGLRNDNYWILDAMYIDKIRMRNRVATDLWNDFATDAYYKPEEKNMINGTRGQFVEVFIDDEYLGLYCMTERIDRKQLKLKKYQTETETIRGVLYKSGNWTYSTMFGYVPNSGPNPDYYLSDPSNYQGESWDGYEVKCPDLDDGEPVDWRPLYDAVKFTAKSSSTTFANEVEDYFDLPVWLDYYLLMEIMLATDNHGKNCYFSLYNTQEESKMLITPWDLDGTFGRQWGGSQTEAQQNFTEYIVSREHGEFNLFRRLKANNVAGFNDKLKARYDQLRFTWFSAESLNERFETYMKMFTASRAATREEKRWGLSSLADELDYVKAWVNDRVEYLNEQYGEPIVVSVTNITFATIPTDKLEVGAEFDLLPYVTVEPSDATNKEVLFTSSAPEVAIIEGSTIKILKAGTATITVTSVNNIAVSKTQDITIPEPKPIEVEVTGITFATIPTDKLEVGAEFDLLPYVTVEPSDATNKEVVFTSSAPEVAIIEGSTIKILKAGTATITVTSVNNIAVSKTQDITIPEPKPIEVEVTGITFATIPTDKLEVGAEFDLLPYVTVEPSDATNKEVVFTSSAPDIAEIEGSTIKTLKAGITTITVTSADNDAITNSQTIEIKGDAAIDNINTQTIIYPNPVIDYLYVDNLDLGTDIRIYTDSGVCLYTNKATNTSLRINLNNHIAGRYYLKVGKTGKVIIKK